MTEWMPVNPCDDCRITFVALKEACKHCEALIRWHIESEALRKLLEYLIATPTCRDGMYHYCPNCDHTIVGDNEYKIKDMLKELEAKE